jgi:hypothetical protein
MLLQRKFRSFCHVASALLQGVSDIMFDGSSNKKLLQDVDNWCIYIVNSVRMGLEQSWFFCRNRNYPAVKRAPDQVGNAEIGMQESLRKLYMVF